MHSQFPHPANRILVLRVHWPLENVDLEVIPRLLEERAGEFGPMRVLLEICDLPASESPARFIEPLLPRIAKDVVENLALVLPSADLPRVRDLESWWTEGTVRCFSTDERGDALAWIET